MGFSIRASIFIREMRGPGRSGRRKVCNLILPEVCQTLISGLKFIASNHLSANVAVLVVDQHAVALVLPADGRTGWINCTGKTITLQVLFKKRTFFLVIITPAPAFFFIIIRNFISILRKDMGKKEVFCYAKPAVIITAGKLPLDPDKYPETPAAFTTAVAYKFHHTTYVICGRTEIKHSPLIKDRGKTVNSSPVIIERRSTVFCAGSLEKGQNG
jgi:hypothetical protein